MSPPLVTDSRSLAAACERMASAEFLAVDTEFVRDRTYFPQLCLVQLATPSEHLLVDPIALEDLSSLRDLLLRPELLKVLHASRQDLELFHHLWGSVPSPVFDTQLGASVAGLGDQVSYAQLVRQLVGVNLQKGSTLTDWARRPLSAQQLEYAAADVVHLVPAYVALRGLLAEKGRSEWLESEMSQLSDSKLHAPDPSSAWEGVKGGGNLSGTARAVLRELAAWRDTEAQVRNVPRRWILSDDFLVALAKHPQADLAALRSNRMIAEALVQRCGADIVASAQRGVAAPRDESPRSAGPTDEQRVLVDLMACLVRLRAAEHGVSPASLAARADLESVAMAGASSGADVLSGWRRDIVGEDLIGLREGRVQLVVQDGAVRIVK